MCGITLVFCSSSDGFIAGETLVQLSLIGHPLRFYECYELRKGITVCEPFCLFRECVEIIDSKGEVYRTKAYAFFDVLGHVDEATERLPVTVKTNVKGQEIVSIFCIVSRL